jgi:hypothetical protein
MRAGEYRDLTQQRTIIPMGMGRRLGAVMAAALILLLIPCAAAAVSSHCSAEERTLFSCSTGRKVVSVCGSQDLSAAAGSVQYRFGPIGAPELTYPRAGDDWRQVTSSGVLTFAGGGGTYLAFTKGPFRYVVYTAIGRGWGSKAGVVVDKGGKRVASLPCKGEEKSELGPDLFGEAGLPEDKNGFDVP